MGSCLALLAAWSLATPPAGSLAYVSAASGQSGRIVVVDVAPGRPEPSERASVATSGEIGELTFSPKRDRVAYASRWERRRLWTDDGSRSGSRTTGSGWWPSPERSATA